MLEDFIWGSSGSADLVQLALLLVVLYNWHAAVDKGVEALAHGLRVVVTAPTGLAALSQPLLHCLLAALKVQHLQVAQVLLAADIFGMSNMSDDLC